MGGHPWFYFVDYEPDINTTLQRLREREFQAGRYTPVVDFPDLPVTPLSLAPGAGHDLIEEAFEGADGMRSILEMMSVSATADYCAVAPLPQEDLMSLFGTDGPTREMIEESDELSGKLERGQGVYVIVYKNDQPSEIFFAGYNPKSTIGMPVIGGSVSCHTKR